MAAYIRAIHYDVNQEDNIYSQVGSKYCGLRLQFF